MRIFFPGQRLFIISRLKQSRLVTKIVQRHSNPIFHYSMPQLTLNLIQGAVTFKFSSEAAKTLKAEIDQLMGSLKVIATQSASGGRPQPQKPMEYTHTGEVFIELFCNPNIYPSPFAAKVLLTVRDERIRLTTEAELTRIIEDLGQYLDQMA